jgi:hypothetical protein
MNSTANAAVRATMCRRDTIDLQQRIVQIITKLPVRYHLHQIPIGCRQNPNIHFVRATAP